jgi:hypothetical protein
MSIDVRTAGQALLPDDEARLREVVGSIARDFGHEYFACVSAEQGTASELWTPSRTGASSASTSPRSTAVAAWV